MGLLDWLRPRPPRRSTSQIARDLATATFALHPTALERVVLRLGVVAGRRVVVAMEVPATDPARSAGPPVDRAQQTAAISALASELAAAAPTSGDEVTVMRDRVIWMPVVAVFNPAVP